MKGNGDCWSQECHILSSKSAQAQFLWSLFYPICSEWVLRWFLSTKLSWPKYYQCRFLGNIIMTLCTGKETNIKFYAPKSLFVWTQCSADMLQIQGTCSLLWQVLCACYARHFVFVVASSYMKNMLLLWPLLMFINCVFICEFLFTIFILFYHFIVLLCKTAVG